MERDKTHIDYGYEIDLVVKPESSVPMFNREFAAFTGSGIPLFSLGGGASRQALSMILAGFHARRGYYVVETPIIASSELFKVSGHLQYYRENMFVFDIEGHDFVVKPMNCPYHILLFLNHVARSRGKTPIPFKVYEFGRVHRYEPSGSLYGLLRVRSFTQDDAHIILTGEHVGSTVKSIFEEMRILLEKVFKLEVTQENIHMRLSLADKSLVGKEFMGTLEEWTEVEESIKGAAEEIGKEHGIPYSKLEGEAAFYGPKIDFLMRVEEAGYSKEWQLGTIQFDFNLPRRFKLNELLAETHRVEQVYIIHRALLGSIERFLGVYLEHFKGRLPVYIAPVQVAIIGIRTGHEETDSKIELIAREVKNELVKRGLRVAKGLTNKTGLSGYVRQLESTVKPFINIFIGAREVREGYATLYVFNHKTRERDKVRVTGSEPLEIAIEIEKLIESMEKDVVSVSGVRPRVPGDYSHLL